MYKRQVLDLDFGSRTAIGKSERALSTDPKKVVEHSKVFIRILKGNNIISCGKHFPGQGSAVADAHVGFTSITDTWTYKELIPFDELIQSGDLDMIMVGHVFEKNLDANLPASLSNEIITKMLRNDLGFTGIVICDDPSMRALSEHYDLEHATKLMLDAGVDLFCLGNNLIFDPSYITKVVSILSELVRSQEIACERIKESIERIKTLKLKYKFYE